MSLFTQYFADTITVYKFCGTNAYGDTIYSPPLSADGLEIACRIEYKTQETLDTNGNKVISTATVYADEPIAPLSIVYADGERYTVKSCQPIKDLHGWIDHYEIIL